MLAGLVDLAPLFSVLCGLVRIFFGAVEAAAAGFLAGAPTAFSEAVIFEEVALLAPVAAAEVAAPDDVTFADDVTFTDDVIEVFLAGTKPDMAPPEVVLSRVMGTEETSGISERGRLLELGREGKSDTPEIFGPRVLDLGFFFFFLLVFSLLSIGGGSCSSLRRVRAAVILCAEINAI